MASQPAAPNPPTCQFIKENGESCKRTVSLGESRCWQHARSWGHRYRSLTRNQSVIFYLTVLGVVVGIISLVPVGRDFYYRFQKTAPEYAAPPPKVEYLPTPPSDQQGPPLQVTMTVFISPSWMALVRRDMKMYSPADIFMIWRITNMTHEEFQVDTLEVELVRRPPLVPVKLYLLRPDEAWRPYCGSTAVAYPCTFDSGFLNDVLRSGIAATHTTHGVGLFQVPQGLGYSPKDVSRVRATIVDVRGKRYLIDIVSPQESSMHSLEEAVIKTGHPSISLSHYQEERAAITQ